MEDQTSHNATDSHGAVLVADRPLEDRDVRALCARLRALARAAGGGEVVCDVGALAPDARSVDALARLQLTARRLGCPIRLRHVSRELGGLLSFLGLAELAGSSAS